MNPSDYPPIAPPEQWLAARQALLVEEKSLTRQRDRVNVLRRELPRVAVNADYRFQGPKGEVRLLDLFEGRSQLLVYHFMYLSEQGEGCAGCSFLVDNIGHQAHLHARDTQLVLVSRAPLADLQAFQRRMGWTLPWYSSLGSRFNYDFHVSLDASVAPVQYNYCERDQAELERLGPGEHLQGEQPGLSVFLREGEQVFHTYSTYARGLDALVGTYSYLDLTPWGRLEGWDGMPALNRGDEPMAWLRHHDRYGAQDLQHNCCNHAQSPATATPLRSA